jgi:hypothetical protein
MEKSYKMQQTSQRLFRKYSQIFVDFSENLNFSLSLLVYLILIFSSFVCNYGEGSLV